MKRGSELFRRLFGSGKLPILLLLLLVIPAVAWLGTVPYFAAHDSTTHRWRVWEFWQVWQQTGGLPRWVPDLHYGFGSPLFSLYSPLAYLFGAAAQAWGLPAYDSTKLVYALGLALAGTGTFALSAEVNRSSPSRYWAGLLGAAAYLYAPYILANVSIRGAIAETLALGILPWLLFFELRALRQLGRASSMAESFQVGRGSLIGLIISASGLILAHNLTALVASILAVLLALLWLLWWGSQGLTSHHLQGQLTRIAPLLLSVALALMLSAFYWLPVAVEYSFVHIERARGSALSAKFSTTFIEPSSLVQVRPIHDYRQDYSATQPGPHLGMAQVACFALAVPVLLVTRRRERGLVGWLIVPVGALGTILLTLPISLPVWQALPILTILQFPWRLLGVASLLGAITVSGLATLGRLGRPLAIGLSLALMLGGMWVNVSPYDWRPEWESAANLRDFERQSQSFGLTGDEEFLPTMVQRDRWTLFDPESGVNAASWASRSDRPIAIQLVSSDLRRWSSEVETTEGSTLTLDSFHYPTLRARIDGEPVEARPEGDLGLLTIDLPPGRHLLEISYEPSLVERAGDWLSGLTLVGIVGLAVASRLRSRKVGRRHLRAYASLALLIPFAPLLLTAVNPADATRQSSMHYVDSSSGEATSPRLLGARIDPSRAGSTARVEVELTTFLSHVPDAAVLVVTRSAGAFGRSRSGGR